MDIVKAIKGLIALTLEIDYDKTAAVFLIAK
jgi:hypothetical protein